MPVAEPSYRFPVQQAAFLRALKGGGYQGVARSGRGPLSVSLVSQMPPVYQQALQGTCVANAVTALLEYHDDLRTRLSVQFLFAATKEVERNGLELNFRNLRTGQPLDPGFESVFHKELAQLRMLAATNGGMAAPVVLPYLARFEEAVRERFFVSSGCLLQSCFQALETYGVCRDVLWPYAPVQAAPVFGSSAAGRVEFPPKTREDAEKRRMTHGLYRLGTPNNVDEIRSFLAGANERRPMPVVVTVDFFEGCDGETYKFPETETDAEGHLVAVNELKGRHGLLIVGYMDSSAYAGGGYFIIRNSLGAGWGNRGYGKLPYAYLECFAREAGTIQQDLIDYEGDGYGGQLLGEKRAPGTGRRARRMWLVNGLVALALVAGTVAVEVCLDDPLGLRRLKPPPAPARLEAQAPCPAGDSAGFRHRPRLSRTCARADAHGGRCVTLPSVARCLHGPCGGCVGCGIFLPRVDAEDAAVGAGARGPPEDGRVPDGTRLLHRGRGGECPDGGCHRRGIARRGSACPCPGGDGEEREDPLREGEGADRAGAGPRRASVEPAGAL